jgi:hypothetical protein
MELTSACFATSAFGSCGAVTTERETHASGCAGHVRNRVPGGGGGDVPEGTNGDVEDDA